jgi:hypothetical protein
LGRRAWPALENARRSASRSLIAAYLFDRASHELAGLVTPRREFHDHAPRNQQIGRFAAMAADIEDLSLYAWKRKPFNAEPKTFPYRNVLQKQRTFEIVL